MPHSFVWSSPTTSANAQWKNSTEHFSTTTTTMHRTNTGTNAVEYIYINQSRQTLIGAHDGKEKRNREMSVAFAQHQRTRKKHFLMTFFSQSFH